MKKPDQRYLIALQLGRPAFLQNVHPPYSPLIKGGIRGVLSCVSE
jgi:hypothetical protein